MKLVWCLIGYALISAALYVALREKCKKDAVFRPPNAAWLHYTLAFTWGLPMTFVGCIAALILRIKGFKPVRYGRAWCIAIPGIDWGLSLGIFFIVPEGHHESLKAHEFGHTIQNVCLGVFMPAVVGIPSLIRFWYRDAKERRGHPCESSYDDIWFEGSATKSGTWFINVLKVAEAVRSLGFKAIIRQ